MNKYSKKYSHKMFIPIYSFLWEYKNQIKCLQNFPIGMSILYFALKVVYIPSCAVGAMESAGRGSKGRGKHLIKAPHEAAEPRYLLTSDGRLGI